MDASKLILEQTKDMDKNIDNLQREAAELKVEVKGIRRRIREIRRIFSSVYYLFQTIL